MTFKSETISDQGNGIYNVVGKLTIKGKEYDLTLPLKLEGVKKHPAKEGTDVADSTAESPSTDWLMGSEQVSSTTWASSAKMLTFLSAWNCLESDGYNHWDLAFTPTTLLPDHWVPAGWSEERQHRSASGTQWYLTKKW